VCLCCLPIEPGPVRTQWTRAIVARCRRYPVDLRATVSRRPTRANPSPRTI